ncbi:hypothetical protein ACFSJY_12275 [Thalassotalea euphylliae]|uniref:hypothetical protein n=1 Tax=Thalassotalea euphylliae TaxID=1655234 RepID=UPI003627C5FE
MMVIEKTTLIKLISGFIVAFVIAVASFYWKAAHDEIFYLCGNFYEGIDKANVIRQLDTANLSHYEITRHRHGSEIVFMSNIFWVTEQCIISFNEDEIADSVRRLPQ